MKKVNKTFVVYCLLLVLSTVSISLKATEEDKKDIDVSTKVVKLNDRNEAYDPILLYCSLGLNIVALILISVCLKQQHSKKKTICNIREELRQITANLSASPSSSNNANSAVNITQREIEQVVDRVLNERKIDAIVDRVLECVHLDNKIKDQDTPIIEQSQVPQNEVQETITLLYASAANRATNTFYNVTEQPIPGSSIYVLKLSGNKAAFEVYSGAHEKILKDANFLECACELQLNGKSKVITIRSGSSEKQPDGQWSIKSQAIIKFE